MKRFLRSKLVLLLTTVMMITAAVVIPLAGTISHSRAATTRAYAPWTQSDYNETNNRFNTQETTIGANNLNSLTPQWVLNNATIQKIGQLGIAGNPVVNYDRVYVAAINGNLYGFDEQTGSLNWHIDLTHYQQGAYPDSLQVTNGKVYVSIDGSLGIAVFDATNSNNGLLWQTSHFTATFAISGGVLYTSDGYVYDANTGKQLWHKKPPCGGSPLSYLSSMSVDSSQGLGYEDCYDVATLYAFHLSDGSIAWTVPLENQGHNTELVAADGMVYVEGVYFTKLYAFDAQTGNSVWAAIPAPSRAPVIANGILYMSYWDNVANASYVAAIDAKKGPNPDGSFMWKVPTGFAYDTTVANGILYQTGYSGGPIRAFDAATGNNLAYLSFSTIGQLITPITIGDGMIVGAARTPSGTQFLLYAVTLPGTLPPPSPLASMSLSVTTDLATCNNTLTFALQGATADQFRVSSNGMFLTKLSGKTTTYVDTISSWQLGYLLYEVAAFKNGHFLGLARSFLVSPNQCPIGTVATPPYPKPPLVDSTNDLFVIVGGINSQLVNANNGAQGNNGYGYDPTWESYNALGNGTAVPGIASYLMWNGYLNSRFIIFSYNNYTNDGMPGPYNCANTFDNGSKTTFFQQEVLQLSKQIQAAVGGRTNLRVHILAHSQGGVIALGYAFALAKNLDGVVQLPTGVKLHDIDLFDSPVGGTLYDSNYQTDLLLKLGCLGASKYNDIKQMHTLFSQATDATEYGKSASIVGSFFGLNPTDPNNSNQVIAVFTHQTLQSTIFLAGNDNDYLWQPSGCTLGLDPDFRSTENLIDDGNNGIASRRFTSASDVSGCVPSIGNTFNHLDALTDPNVQQAVLQVVQGGTPGLTPYTG